MAYSAVQGPTGIDVDDEVRQSLISIRRERSTKLVLALSALVALLVAGSAFVYLAYSSEPGTTRVVPASER